MMPDLRSSSCWVRAARDRASPESDIDLRCSGRLPLDAFYLALARARNRSSGPDRPSPRRPSSCDAVARKGRRSWSAKRSVPANSVPGVSPVLRYRQAPSRRRRADHAFLEREAWREPIDAAIIRASSSNRGSLDGLRLSARWPRRVRARSTNERRPNGCCRKRSRRPLMSRSAHR